MKSKYLSCLFLLVVACSGGQTTGGDKAGAQSVAQLKKAAAEAHAKKEPQPGDVCAEHAWYGDGECDTFCQDFDSNDCVPAENDPVVCATFIELSDGVCSRKPDDPCIGQDPDCTPGDDPVHSHPQQPPGGIVCPAIAEAPDGVCKVDLDDPCAAYIDPDCQNGEGGGQTPPPTNPQVCAQYIEQPDGVCGRDPSDPCIFQDPDCHVK